MNLGPEYPELLAELAMQLHATLIQAGIEPATASRIARDCAERIRQDWGGQIIYVPIGQGFDTMQRWQEIWGKFKGDNVAELAREYKLTEVHVYRIVSKMRELERRSRQSDLFPSEVTRKL